jgi:hypothetical protein
MTPRRWALVALGLAALAWALGGEWVSISHRSTPDTLA